MNGFIEFIVGNLTHTGPLLFLCALAIALAVERIRVICWVYPHATSDQFHDKLRDLVSSDRLPQALALCDRYIQKPSVQVVREGLLQAHQPEEMIEHSLQLVVTKTIQRVQVRTAYLGTIANVATLLGLFGTIQGLVQSFSAIGSVSGQQKSAFISAGISTAMNSTLFGLGLAIPCMLLYSFLAGRSNTLISEIEASYIQTLRLIKERYYGSNSSATAAASMPPVFGKAASK